MYKILHFHVGIITHFHYKIYKVLDSECGADRNHEDDECKEKFFGYDNCISVILIRNETYYCIKIYHL